MIAIIEKGVMGSLDDQVVYSIMIDDETDTDVNFMALLQIDGTLTDLEEAFEFSPALSKKLDELPMHGSLEVDLNFKLDLVG